MDDSSDTSDDSDEELLSEKVDLSPDIKSQDAHKSGKSLFMTEQLPISDKYTMFLKILVIDNPTVKR